MTMTISSWRSAPDRESWLIVPRIVAALLPLLSACSLLDNSRLDTIKRDGKITVLTFAGTTTYYETPDGPIGFEYDLAKAFADQLGVELRFVAVDKLANVIPRLVK